MEDEELERQRTQAELLAARAQRLTAPVLMADAPVADTTIAAECVELWDRLKADHERLHNRPVEHATNKRRKLLELRIAHYRNELQVLREEPSHGPREETASTIAAVHAALTEGVGQLRELAARLAQRQQRLAAAVERKRGLVRDHMTLDKALEGKLTTVAEQQSRGEDDEVEQLRARIKTLQEKNKKLLKSMGTFGRDYFPPPSHRDLVAAKRQRQSTLDEFVEVRFASLNTILEQMMNASITRPHDPYVVIDQGRHWPPYIELILRWGIGVKHPRDPSLMKLIEFHI